MFKEKIPTFKDVVKLYELYRDENTYGLGTGERYGKPIENGVENSPLYPTWMKLGKLVDEILSHASSFDGDYTDFSSKITPLANEIKTYCRYPLSVILDSLNKFLNNIAGFDEVDNESLEIHMDQLLQSLGYPEHYLSPEDIEKIFN